jgi:hypothetical protein
MKKLKVIIITSAKCIYTWQETVINDLKRSNYADIVLNITLKNEDELHRINKLPLILKSYIKIDSKLFNPSPYALSRAKSTDNPKDFPQLTLDNDLNIESLKSYESDIIINLTVIKVSKLLSTVTKYGLWFFSCGDLDGTPKRPFGIWEMINNKPYTSASLRFLSINSEFSKTIDSTNVCTDSLSFKRNINAILWQLPSLLKSNIELLAKNKELFVTKLNENTNLKTNKPTKVPFSPPSNLKTLGFALKLYLKKAIQVIQSIFYFNQWALIFLNIKDTQQNPYDLKQYTQILPPKDRFWADPFLIKYHNKTYLFIEEFIYANKLGHIAVMKIDENGSYTKPETILVKDYHLSYPFVFEDNNEFYMIPETSGNEDIQLYKAIDFPLKWKLEKTMMKNVVAVDTTIYKEDNVYWMFTNIKKHKGSSKHVELNVFSSNSLLTDIWKPHPLNPVIKDVKTARPAGKLFKIKNKLYRPSQNCSNHYGYGLNISEITELNATAFKEQIATSITPNWSKNISCTHSFNSVDTMYISDVKIKRSRFF